jgi:hypothetical protein
VAVAVAVWQWLGGSVAVSLINDPCSPLWQWQLWQRGSFKCGSFKSGSVAVLIFYTLFSPFFHFFGIIFDVFRVFFETEK